MDHLFDALADLAIASLIVERAVAASCRCATRVGDLRHPRLDIGLTLDQIPLMPLPVQLLTASERLTHGGSMYFEFGSGEWNGKHWGEESVFVHGEVVELFVAQLRNAVADFDYYGLTGIDQRGIGALIAELQDFAESLTHASSNGQAFQNQSHAPDPSDYGCVDWSQLHSELRKLVAELCGWLRTAQVAHGKVWVFGL